jgi:glutaredoxin
MSGAVSAPTGIAVAGGIAVFEDDDGLFALPAAVPPSPLGKLSPEMMEKLALQAALSSLERQSRESGPLPRDLLGRGPAVVVYGTQWCGACKRARAYLDETGVAYRDLDVELNAAAEDDYRVLMKKHGYSAGAVPLITVGERAMLGFSPARLRTWLREAKLLR